MANEPLPPATCALGAEPLPADPVDIAVASSPSQAHTHSYGQGRVVKRSRVPARETRSRTIARFNGGPSGDLLRAERAHGAGEHATAKLDRHVLARHADVASTKAAASPAPRGLLTSDKTGHADQTASASAAERDHPEIAVSRAAADLCRLDGVHIYGRFGRSGVQASLGRSGCSSTAIASSPKRKRAARRTEDETGSSSRAVPGACCWEGLSSLAPAGLTLASNARAQAAVRSDRCVQRAVTASGVEKLRTSHARSPRAGPAAMHVESEPQTVTAANRERQPRAAHAGRPRACRLEQGPLRLADSAVSWGA
jgi:hypothetical protein